MNYSEHLPPPRLAPFVHCIWTLEGDAGELGAETQPILPDGHSELIVHFGDPFERIQAHSVVRQPVALFAGQLTGPLVLRPTGRISVVGIRFHPDGAAALLDGPQHELAGLTIDVEAVSATLSRSLNDVRSRAASVTDGARLLRDCLIEKSERTRIDPRVRMAVQLIHRRHGAVAIDDLADHIGLTRRHLERRFSAVVGVSPKRLARIIRFRRALQIFERIDVSQPGTYAAAACGYADQSHFIRDFRELAGCAPSAHLMRHAEINQFFGRNKLEPIS